MMKKILVIAVMCMFFASFGFCKNSNAVSNDEFTAKLEKSLKETADIPFAISYLNDLFDVAYIIAQDHTGVEFTLSFQGDKMNVEKGHIEFSLPASAAVLTLPMSDTVLKSLSGIFNDSKLSDREEFLLINATFKPALEAAYRIPALKNPIVRKYGNMDGVVQVALWNPHKIKIDGEVIKNGVTIMPDGNGWKVLDGFHGKADIRMVVSPNEAADMYRVIMRDFRTTSSLVAKTKALIKYYQIRKDCLVFN